MAESERGAKEASEQQSKQFRRPVVEENMNECLFPDPSRGMGPHDINKFSFIPHFLASEVPTFVGVAIPN